MPAPEMINSMITKLGIQDNAPNREYMANHMSLYREEIIEECQISIKSLGLDIVTCKKSKLTDISGIGIIWEALKDPFFLVRWLSLCSMKLCSTKLETLKR